jgi:hypothetical protein
VSGPSPYDETQALVPASPAYVAAEGTAKPAPPLIERFEDLDEATIAAIIEGATRRSKVAGFAMIGGAMGYVGFSMAGVVAGWPAWIASSVGALYTCFALSYVVAMRRGYTREARALGVSPAVAKRLRKEATRVGARLQGNTDAQARTADLAGALMRVVDSERQREAKRLASGPASTERPAGDEEGARAPSVSRRTSS